MSVPKRVAVIVAAVLGVWGLLGLADAALAQDASGQGEAPETPSTEVVTPAVPTPRASEIGVQIARLGVGGKARPGEWTAIQVVLTNQTDKIRSVLVRAIIPDPDGDRAAYERTIVSNPGATQSVWLYVQLPFTLDTGSALTVSAHEAEEEADGAGAKFRAGRELGSASLRLTQGNTVAATTGLLCVVGDRAAALDQYTVRQQNVDYAPTGHELTDLLTLQIADVPDRVMGLLAFDTIVWTGSGQGRDPTDLSRDQAAALREWVKRGGHLVVVLPNAGQSWLARPDNPLADLMPAASPVLFEGVDLAPMRRLFTLDGNVPLPSSFIVQALKPDPGAGPYDAIPILSVPPDYPATGLAGQPLVIRKLIGEGAVSVVGVDVSRPTLTSIRAVEADIFWNRVIGRRINLLKPDELAQLQNRGAFYVGGRRDKVLDAGIGGEIAKTAEAAAGLLLAFVVFGLYWLFAGPVGHFVLRRRDLRRHSWLAFVGIAGVFTALAWGGASAIKAKRVSGNHLTFIDHVYGQSSQRTRSWVNIHVPRYGDVRVSAAGAKSSNPDDWHVSVSPWDDPEAGSSGWGSFPDSREYAVESRAPEELVVPFRSTTKQFRIDWAGPVREKWGMPRPVVDGSTQLGKEIVLTHKKGEGREWELHGKLVHDLPGDLTDVQIVVVPCQGRLNIAPEYALVHKAVAVTLQVWRPGQVLDFDATELSKAKSDSASIEAREWLKRLLGVPSQYADALQDRAQRTSASDLTGLSFFSMLEPPPQAQLDRAYVARRRSAHTLDLGRWFTQPCIIIVGQLADEGTAAGSPTPLAVDGRDVELRGRTVVRWVYPLAADPPEYGPRLDAAAPTGPEAEASPEAEPAPAPPPQGRRRR